MSAPPTAQPSAEVELVVRSRALARVLEEATRVASSSCHVLILGERGVGKDRVAQHLHKQSGRERPMIAVNCATIQPALAESTLFGHARGAFTGAQTAALGLVRQAEGGTLFLDEVGMLPPEVQARLLRMLQEGVVQPLGERERKVDVRIVAATNADLDDLVARGLFRADLRDRLSLMILRVPPLRERPDEILPLAEHFLATAKELGPDAPKALSAGARRLLRAADWPGNVRELRNVVVSAALLADGEVLTAPAVRAALARQAPVGGEGSGEVRRGRYGPREVHLEALEPGRSYAIRDLVPLLRLPYGTVKRRVQALVAEGALLTEGHGPGRRYRRPGEARLPSGPRGSLSERILGWLDRHESASTGELEQALGAARTTLKRAVQDLLAMGRIARVGVGRAARLRRVEAPTVPARQPVPEIASPVPPAPSATPATPATPAPSADVTPRRPSAAPRLRPGGSTPNPTQIRQQEQDELALGLARREGLTTARHLAAALGQTLRTAERVLARLCAEGRLRPDGFARARRYLPAGELREQRSPEAPPRRPSLSVNGETLRIAALRLALALAASPAGATPSRLARGGLLTEPDAARLLDTLGAVGLLHGSAGSEPCWRLHAPEASAWADTA